MVTQRLDLYRERQRADQVTAMPSLASRSLCFAPTSLLSQRERKKLGTNIDSIDVVTRNELQSARFFLHYQREPPLQITTR
jgi:hypothetical protein